MGRCGPLAGALDSLEVVACSYLVDSLVRAHDVTSGELGHAVSCGNSFCAQINVYLTPPLPECLLVQPGLVPDLPHSQHHLLYKAGQVLQEDETH